METDRNLLFGVLALQADLIDAGHFVEACSAWAARKDVPLAEIMRERGWINEDDRAVIDHLLERKLVKHKGDPQASLAAVVDDEVRRILGVFDDPEIQHTLAELSRQGGHILLSTVDHSPGSRDRYTLTSLHAVGGIGRVWLARDPRIGREVALKELRPERASQAAIWSRFLDEARITGQLEHPGIVPVYEVAGDPGEESPFYTMRFVRGRTLTESIRTYHGGVAEGRDRKLEGQALLNAFVGVCQAIAYAHSRGVIHRDLKGQNVVLGDFGEVIVLDWGLAKRVDDRDLAAREDEATEPEEGRDETREGQILGTPAYMAPEQALGRRESIDERTDVYGLGAILYEILAGRPPFPGSDTREVLRRVVEQEPEPPRRVAEGVPPDLEAVCLKAMAKDPANRYASASELAEEVRRHLADEPVRAYREPWPSRVGRWTRRHRTASAASAALMVTAALALAVGIVAVEAERRETADARDEASRNLIVAREQKAQAEGNLALARDAVDRYFTQISEARLLNEPGLQPLRRELLGTALDYHRTITDRSGDAPASRIDLLRAYGRMAEITEQVGSPEEALALNDRAVTICRTLQEEERTEREVRVELSRSLINRGRFLQTLGRRDEAEATFREALGTLDDLAGESPLEPEVESRRADLHDALAQLAHAAGRTEEAEASYRQALRMREDLASANPDVRRFARLRAAGHYNLALLLRDSNRPEQAEPEFRTALDLRRKLVEAHPEDLEARRDLLFSLGELATFANLSLGDKEQAGGYYREAQEIAEALARENPMVTAHRRDLAVILDNRANFLRERGQAAEALDLHEQALAIRRGLVEDYPEVERFRTDLAASLGNVGGVRLALGDLEEAERLTREAVERFSELVGSAAPAVETAMFLGISRYQLALILARTDRSGPAEEAFAEAVATLDDVLKRSPGHFGSLYYLAQALGDLGELRSKRGDDQAALRDWSRALEVAPDSIRNQLRFGHALALARAGRTAEALGEVEGLAPESIPGGTGYHALARLHALCAGGAPDGDASGANHRGLALKSLRKAEQAGYFRTTSDPLGLLDREADLASLRDLPEYLAFREGLTGRVEPRAEGAQDSGSPENGDQ